MATATIEERLSALEQKVEKLLSGETVPENEREWWHERLGAFKDDPLYDEAMRLGAEYRRSQPTAADEIEAMEQAGGDVPDGH